jgi:hypothetical protein
MNWWECAKDYPIHQVNISNLENYLKDRGWVKEAFGREEVFKFKSPQPFHEDKFIEILIPSQEDLIDYKRSIEIAIGAISTFEKRSFDDVLSQILIFSDLLKFQISTPKTKKGSIPIIDGITLYKGISDLLVYSACAEISLQKSFLKKLGRALDFIKTCQIAQSQYGSYVANIQCQLERPKYLDPETNRRLSPLGRKTVLRILKGINNLNSSIQEETVNPIINNYDVGLNANMCDTLIDIIEIGQNNDIKISTNLEPIWGIPENITTDVFITPYAKVYLQEASEKLREENPEERRELKGHVFQLRRKPDEEENTIRVLAFDEEGEPLPVIVKVDEASYQLAIDAHKFDKLIKIKGILTKIGRTWYLDNPEPIEITNN